VIFYDNNVTPVEDSKKKLDKLNFLDAFTTNNYSVCT